MCPPQSDNRATTFDVVPACDYSAMTYLLRGTELRYVLTMHLGQHGVATIPEMLAALDHHGFCVRGRPSKTVSDALRWEEARGRVWRRGRGRYGPGEMPRSTEHRIHQRVLALREAASRSEAGTTSIASGAGAKVADVTRRSEVSRE